MIEEIRTDGINLTGLDALEARLVIVGVVSWTRERGPDSAVL